jgi:hypothetical protein
MTEEEDCQNLICRDDPFADIRKILKPSKQKECPLNRKDLGYFSWSILHSFAAYYPKQPRTEDK